MTESNLPENIKNVKPKWIETLESAERVLRRAEETTDDSERGTLNAVAHTYLDIAKAYRTQFNGF